MLERIRRRRPARKVRRGERPPVRPLAADFWMLAAAAAAAAAIWFTTAWLLGVADDAPAKERAKTRVDAVRTGLYAGAGVGAAVGLMLAIRRQRHQEIATALSDHDAAERRVTDLYNAAAEHLGSDKAPVRLTALYTLERLANDNPAHRQTIVNIICAYLRMPYTPPGNTSSSADEQRLASRRYRTARTGVLLPPPEPEIDPHEEHQVRLTAQRILGDGLRRNATTHWEGMTLDLSGATLVDFSLYSCALDTALCGDAIFYGHTSIREVFFSRTFSVRGAVFSGSASFRETHFPLFAFFGEATFSGPTDFGTAFFPARAHFEDTTFSGTTSFDETEFSGEFSEVDPPPGWRIVRNDNGTGRLERMVT